MTDINKQIEEERILDDIELEALKYARQEYPNSTKPIQAIVAGDCSLFAKQILDSSRYSSRWRKVSEELPEMGYRVLVRNEFKVSHLGYIDTVGDWRYCLNNELIKDKLLEWKPID